MKKFFVLFGLLISLFAADVVLAQTVLTVPLGSSSFAWTAGAPTATTSLAREHVITCGSSVVVVPAPQSTIRISDVVPGPGTYDCSIFARNGFGRSATPDPSFPRFDAGYVPGAPVELRLIVE